MTQAHPHGTSSTTPRILPALAWAAAVVVVLQFLWIAQHKYALPDPAAYGMFWTRRQWLWTHLAGGTLAMVLGALQFVGGVRRAWPRVHRWIGRAYLCGVAIGLVGAAGLVLTSPAPPAIRIAFAATGLAWFTTALAGFIAIRRGRVQAHRRWMLRAFLVTLAPATFRLSLLVPGVMALGSPAVMIPLLLWLSWVVPLLVVEAGRRAWPGQGRLSTAS